jgi:pyrroloquinoline-quinone synthase
MSREIFIQELQSEIDKRHLLKHPFYQMWNRGTLPIEVMRKYAEQYYHLEKNFPTFLSKIHASCTQDEFDVRQAITDNLYDEEHGVENHRELWLRFGESIGASRQEIQNSEPLAETNSTIAVFNELSSRSYLEGVSALSAYESQIPAVAETKLDGLEKNYAMTDERGQKFFKVHGVMDIEHANSWWDIISEHADTEEEKNQVTEAVKMGRDALWSFLDGVCRAYMTAEKQDEMDLLYAEVDSPA